MTNAIISQATKRNWDRLGVSESNAKLTKRANKTNSKKRILPLEYLYDLNNLSTIELILDEITAYNNKIIDIMYSIVLNYFNAHSVAHGINSDKINVQKFLSEYSDCVPIKKLLSLKLPMNEPDLLGFIYQSLHLEGEKNKQGLYYTPASVANQMNSELDFSSNQRLLDPCCGSGSFLLNAQVLHPTQLYGTDCDPIAVMLCKANLITRFKEFDFDPQVYCFDFLIESDLFDSDEITAIVNKQFDYVSTNPPWGAVLKTSVSQINAVESFTCFLKKALHMLKNNGVLNFLLPESFLNVKAHGQLRLNLLANYSLERIQLLPNLFTGVTTKAIALTIANKAGSKFVTVLEEGKTYEVDTLSYRQSANCVFSTIVSKDSEILDALYSKGQYNLSNSIWALGIVTGNNAERLSDIPLENGEAIYTGKEIRAFRLLPPKKHIIYNRSDFQQVAKDEIYRAKEKLAYKFISNKLVFAYDDKQSLFLNSANILIPVIPTISVQSMLVFLNSELFQFAYIKRFGEIKVLKGNLCELPFPKLLSDEDDELKTIAVNIIGGNDAYLKMAQCAIYEYYNISKQQIQYIREVLKNGTFD